MIVLESQSDKIDAFWRGTQTELIEFEYRNNVVFLMHVCAVYWTKSKKIWRTEK